jgi:predicted NBD/HSP70 family sugar kinase
LGLERAASATSVFRAQLLPERHPSAASNSRFAERLLKFLLWQRGAQRVFVAGPETVTRHLQHTYSAVGARAFDAEFFERVYQSFRVDIVRADQVPGERESPRALGGHLDGCRIGFDAGGSDRKVAALIDGRAVFTDEVVWHPKEQADPDYHFAGIDDSIRSAARHLPRIDAIGVSSAGIYLDNRTRVASLFRRVPKAAFEARIAPIYLDIAAKWGGVPLEVANDGDVAALAGALELGEGPVLGLALGTSLAAGYVDARQQISGWLNELSFAPLDYSETAPIDQEWSGDRGTSVHYLSQDAPARLASRAGLSLSAGSAAEKLRELQALAQAGDARALAVYESLGVYLGYALLDYADFYRLKHVLLLGRVTTGAGGSVIEAGVRRVLSREAPELAATLRLHLPGESQRRVGQAVAAASLPRISLASNAPTREKP